MGSKSSSRMYAHTSVLIITYHHTLINTYSIYLYPNISYLSVHSIDH